MDLQNEKDNERFLSIEANAAVRELAFAVVSIAISQTFTNSETEYRINLETLENQRYCVQLTERGFRIIGRDFDVDTPQDWGRYYETIYALLDVISPAYRTVFGGALAAKLLEVAKQGDRVDNQESMICDENFNEER